MHPIAQWQNRGDQLVMITLHGVRVLN